MYICRVSYFERLKQILAILKMDKFVWTDYSAIPVDVAGVLPAASMVSSQKAKAHFSSFFFKVHLPAVSVYFRSLILSAIHTPPHLAVNLYSPHTEWARCASRVQWKRCDVPVLWNFWWTLQCCCHVDDPCTWRCTGLMWNRHGSNCETTTAWSLFVFACS